MRDELPSRSQDGVARCYQRQARDLIDTLHDYGILNASVTREVMDKTEDYLAYLLDAAAKGAVKGHDLGLRMKEIVERKQSEVAK